MEAALRAAGRRPFVKVQTTGPISFGLTIVDEHKRAIYYHPEFVDAVVKCLVMKCRWQIRKFAPFAERVICFIDEPILSGFGSSTYVSVTRDDVVAKLAAYEVFDADPEPLRLKKLQTRESLSEALQNIANHKLVEAESILRTILDSFPEDPAAQLLLHRCFELLGGKSRRATDKH